MNRVATKMPYKLRMIVVSSFEVMIFSRFEMDTLQGQRLSEISDLRLVEVSGLVICYKILRLCDTS